MTTNLRIALEGKFEQVQQATLRWAAAAESLSAEDWDRRRQWTSLALEDGDELEAVAALERKATTLGSQEGLRLLARYRAARAHAERMLSGRLKAFGERGGVPSASVKVLSTHLPLQCSRSFGGILALIGLRKRGQITVTQRVLAVNGFAVPFEGLHTVTLSYVSRVGYLLVAFLRDGSSRSWSFDEPLTDVMEILAAQGVAVSSCAVPHLFGEPGAAALDDGLDWFDRRFPWLR